MPRSPRSNRTDRLTPEAPTAVTGQTYGQAGEQLANQRIVPISGTPTIQPSAPAATQPAPPSGPDLMAATQGHNGPGDSLSLMRPTERPDEPVTHGLPSGPGGGPEALGGVGAVARNGVMSQATVGHFLSMLASQPNAPTAVQDLAARAMNGAQ